MNACPFCASGEQSLELVRTHEPDDPIFGDPIFYVFCNGCGAAGPSATSRRFAVRDWDRRGDVRLQNDLRKNADK